MITTASAATSHACVLEDAFSCPLYTRIEFPGFCAFFIPKTILI